MNVKFPNGVKNVAKGDIFNIRCTPEKSKYSVNGFFYRLSF